MGDGGRLPIRLLGCCLLNMQNHVTWHTGPAAGMNTLSGCLGPQLLVVVGGGRWGGMFVHSIVSSVCDLLFEQYFGGHKQKSCLGPPKSYSQPWWRTTQTKPKKATHPPKHLLLALATYYPDGPYSHHTVMIQLSIKWFQHLTTWQSTDLNLPVVA